VSLKVEAKLIVVTQQPKCWHTTRGETLVLRIYQNLKKKNHN